MRCEVLCIARRPPAWVAEVTAEYTKRLGRALELSFRLLAPGPDNTSVDARKRDEAQRLLKARAAGSLLVALDEHGREHTSAELSARLEAWRTRGQDLCLAIGGADGHGPAVLEAAAESWSLSRLTLPHQMVQVIVAEQLYRALSMLEGHPYHRA